MTDDLKITTGNIAGASESKQAIKNGVELFKQKYSEILRGKLENNLPRKTGFLQDSTLASIKSDALGVVASGEGVWYAKKVEKRSFSASFMAKKNMTGVVHPFETTRRQMKDEGSELLRDCLRQFGVNVQG